MGTDWLTCHSLPINIQTLGTSVVLSQPDAEEVPPTGRNAYVRGGATQDVTPIIAVVISDTLLQHTLGS